MRQFKFLLIGLTCACALGPLAGCAHAPPAELVSARQAYQLSLGQQARLGAEQKAAEADQKARDALAKLAAVKEEQRGLVITLSGSVLFPSDQATLLPEAQTRLNQVAEALLATRERPLV